MYIPPPPQHAEMSEKNAFQDQLRKADATQPKVGERHLARTHKHRQLVRSKQAVNLVQGQHASCLELNASQTKRRRPFRQNRGS